VRATLEQRQRINKFASNRSKSHLNNIENLCRDKKSPKRQKLPTLIKAKRKKKPKR
jgi:hypothetical protein